MTNPKMACPVDGATLDMSERQGIEIDYCPGCRGVWLDRGELDKILERSASEFDPAVAAPLRSRVAGGDWRDPDHAHSADYRHRKRKKSFFEDLFD